MMVRLRANTLDGCLWVSTTCDLPNINKIFPKKSEHFFYKKKAEVSAGELFAFIGERFVNYEGLREGGERGIFWWWRYMQGGLKNSIFLYRRA